jgi:hypothetical protein
MFPGRFVGTCVCVGPGKLLVLAENNLTTAFFDSGGAHVNSSPHTARAHDTWIDGSDILTPYTKYDIEQLECPILAVERDAVHRIDARRTIRDSTDPDVNTSDPPPFTTPCSNPATTAHVTTLPISARTHAPRSSL